MKRIFILMLATTIFAEAAKADTGPDYCRESLRTSFIELATFHLRIKEAVTDAKMSGKSVPQGTEDLVAEMEEKASAWGDAVIELAKEICTS